MKIVLQEHVEHLGSRGEVVNVAAGYARNYLLPKRLAMHATPGNLKVIEQQRRVWEVKEAKEVTDAQAMADRLAALDLQVKKKAGESGTLYGSVTTSEIAAMLAAKGIEVDRRRIIAGESIKTVGKHEVTIKLHRDVIGRIGLEVLPQNPPPAPVHQEEETATPDPHSDVPKDEEGAD